MSQLTQNKARFLQGILTMAGLLIFFNNCSGGYDTLGTSVSALSQTSGVSQMKLNLEIKDSSGNIVYNDATPNMALSLAANKQYTALVNCSNAPSGAAVKLQYTQISAVGAQAQSLSLNCGSNLLPSNLLSQGEYSLVLNATAPNMVPVQNSYNLNVSCASPTFTASSLNAAGLSVAAGSGTNLYNFSASGVIAGANGMAPYQCALDPTGTGIIDTGFQSCSNVFSNVYSNYVGSRNVGIVVKDACNTVIPLSTSLNLAYTVPALGAQNVFISGTIANYNGTTDERVSNVNYLATNPSGYSNVVLTDYNSGTFTINASQNYNMGSSVNYGVKIVVGGITGTVNQTTMSGTLDASTATIRSVSYTTDQAGDSAPALAFTGGNCVLSQQGVKVVYVVGTPCASPQTGDSNKVTIEVWGHYSCTGMSDGTNTMNFTGEFDGLNTAADSCVGAPGGNGGGLPPIQL